MTIKDLSDITGEPICQVERNIERIAAHFGTTPEKVLWCLEEEVKIELAHEIDLALQELSSDD